MKRSGRVKWRQQGGVSRGYGEFRDYADVGGGREALIAPGERLATTDTLRWDRRPPRVRGDRQLPVFDVGGAALATADYEGQRGGGDERGGGAAVPLKLRVKVRLGN